MDGKTCVVSFLKTDSKSIIASVRIARFIAETLQVPIIDRKPVEGAKLGTFENIIMVNGPSAFFDWQDELADMVCSARRVIWVMNDYSIYPPTQVRKVFNDMGALLKVEVWATLPKFPPKWKDLAIWTRFPAEANVYINWNQLTYEHPPLPMTHDKKFEGLFYYGAWRPGREKEFQKYFLQNKYRVHVSCPARAVEKFESIWDYEEIKTEYMFHDKWESFQELQDFQLTLYIHDDFSSEFYCSPANRFYECLSAGLAMVFDSSCVDTMDKAGFNVRDFVVRSPADVHENLLYWKRIREQQRRMWCRDFVGELRKQLIQVGKDTDV